MIKKEVSECSCVKCQDMCRRVPCLPTPADTQALIDAGYKDQLEPRLIPDQHNPLVWAAVRPRYDQNKGACTFLNDQGLCDLHDSGLKPTEGKWAIHGLDNFGRTQEEINLAYQEGTLGQIDPEDGLREQILFTWVSHDGIRVMKQFRYSQEMVSVLKILKAVSNKTF